MTDNMRFIIEAICLSGLFQFLDTINFVYKVMALAQNRRPFRQE